MSVSRSTLADAGRFATVDEWLAWLETLHPKKIDFSLDRVRAVLAALDLKPPPYRVITVGGTNGKGSCVALLESIYLAAGYSVGAFTSPHLWRFNERLRLDGVDATDPQLLELFRIIDAGRGQISLSYFEFAAVAAILFFARERVDVALLEVGMGGRLDAVNAIDADAALIVSIDLDHREWLGEDRNAIGREKAGIIRAGRPAIVGDAEPPESLLSTIDVKKAHGILRGRDFDCVANGSELAFIRDGTPAVALPAPRFGGAIQATNTAACAATVDALQTILPVQHEALVAGLRRAAVPGRWQRLAIDGVEWIFDVAHNPAAANCLRRELDGLPPVRRTVAVFAAMRDKELERLVGPFTAEVERWFVAPVDSERSASPDALANLLRSLGSGRVEMQNDVASACLSARACVRPGDRALVFGSFYTVGPAMAALGLYCEPRSVG